MPGDPRSIPYDLGRVLDLIAEASPSLRSERRWRRLRKIADRRLGFVCGAQTLERAWSVSVLPIVHSPERIAERYLFSRRPRVKGPTEKLPQRALPRVPASTWELAVPRGIMNAPHVRHTFPFIAPRKCILDLLECADAGANSLFTYLRHLTRRFVSNETWWPEPLGRIRDRNFESARARRRRWKPRADVRKRVGGCGCGVGEPGEKPVRTRETARGPGGACWRQHESGFGDASHERYQAETDGPGAEGGGPTLVFAASEIVCGGASLGSLAL